MSRVFGRSWVVVVCATVVAAAIAAAAGPAGAGEASRSREAFKFVSGFFGFDRAREEAAARESAAGLSVIGAGFSRTGTKSLEAALLRLGHKVYDTRSILQLGHAGLWEDAASIYKRTGNLTLIDGLLAEMEGAGYTATLDFPMNLFAEVFAHLRPEAKVLMSVRPSVDSWVEAWMTVNRILGHFVARPWVWVLDLTFTRSLLKTMFDFDYVYPTYPKDIRRPFPWFEVVDHFPSFDGDAAHEAWKQLHIRLESELRAHLPPQRFTTFNVRQGWEPLLDFLGVDEPGLRAEPFPNVNDRRSLEIVRAVMDVVAMGLPLWLLVGGWLSLSCARCARRRVCSSAREKVKRA
mmetsp:Transcript_44757/g.130320  ORF Transcript_44757/g.130320 Transcript_44757/m.130320 type:complete len:349 (+) Transcript_44757:94-1140(+)